MSDKDPYNKKKYEGKHWAHDHKPAHKKEEEEGGCFLFSLFLVTLPVASTALFVEKFIT